MNLHNPFSLHGIDFIESPDVPKMQLGDHPCVTKYGDVVEWISPAERAKTNAWLRQHFGVRNICDPGRFYFSSMYGFAVGRPEDILKLASACV